MNIFMEPYFTDHYREHPLVLVDVGASGGIQSNWTPAQKYLKVIGFEPDVREFENLKKKNGKDRLYLNAGLYKEATTLTFYLTRKQEVSSMFKPNVNFLREFAEVERFDVVDSVEIKADTLDHQFEINKVASADFIKVDTQGSELYILQGAKKTIENNIFGIELEAEFVELYEGQPLFADVDKFVTGLGFQVFDIQGAYWKRAAAKECYRKKGQLIYGNVLYLRKMDSFFSLVSSMPDPNAKKWKVLNALTICFLYGYYDYAHELLHLSRDIFTPAEHGVIKSFIESKVFLWNRLPYIKGQWVVASLIHELWEVIRPMHNKWATMGRKLGNL